MTGHGELDLAWALAGLVACTVPFVVFALVALAGIRARADRLRYERSPRATLDRRLARGEISPEEYFERESALRSTEPVGQPRRRLLRV